jgi:hypothetical protein
MRKGTISRMREGYAQTVLTFQITSAHFPWIDVRMRLAILTKLFYLIKIFSRQKRLRTYESDNIFGPP